MKLINPCSLEPFWNLTMCLGWLLCFRRRRLDLLLVSCWWGWGWLGHSMRSWRGLIVLSTRSLSISWSCISSIWSLFLKRSCSIRRTFPSSITMGPCSLLWRSWTLQDMVTRWWRCLLLGWSLLWTWKSCRMIVGIQLLKRLLVSSC